MYRGDDSVQARRENPLPRKELAFRDSYESFEGIMIPRRDHSREVYYPRDTLVFDEDRHRRTRSRSRSSRSSRRHHHRKYDDSDSDTDSIVSSDAERERSKARNKTLLAACLATVTTVAAGNNIYRSTRAHAARKKQLQDGNLSEHEARAFKKKGTKMDLISLGVAAICLNNAKNGWKRLEGLQGEERKIQANHGKERRIRD
ncbi:MAG: hypothetical protein LQ346_002129 [Caloplaca aetnensis]|nr:MAG: hypothetical protein LQ346_002129 [Caloplaca aetnensis]